MAGGIFILLLYCLSLNLPYINTKEFHGEAGKRVIIAERMLETGQWIVPEVEGAVYLRKPPLFNWLLAFAFKVSGGVSEASARAVSVFAAFLAASSLSVFFRKAASVKGIWFILPGMIFLTFTDVIDKAQRAEIDMTFTLFVTLSLIAWFYLYEVKGRQLRAWVFSLALLGISVLLKGPQAPFFFYCGVAPFLIYKKEAKSLFSWRHLIGILIAFFIFSLWFVPVSGAVGLRNIIGVWWHEVAVRGEPIKAGGFLRHFAEFPFSYISAYLPWLPFAALWSKWRPGIEEGAIKRLALFSIFTLLLSVPFYWAAPGARLRYLLPLSGMLSILVSMPIFKIISGKREEPAWSRRYIRGLGIIFLIAAISIPFLKNRFQITGYSAVFFSGGVLASAVLLLMERKSFGRKMALLFLAVLFAKLMWSSVYFPYHARALSHSRNAAAKINALVPPSAALYNYKTDETNMSYYLKRRVLRIESLDGIREGPEAYVYMHKDVSEMTDLRGFSYIGEPRKKHPSVELYKVGRQ